MIYGVPHVYTRARTWIDYAATLYLLTYFLIQSYIYVVEPGRIYTLGSQVMGIAAFLVLLQAKQLKLSWILLVAGFMFFTVLSSLMISRGSPGLGNIASVLANGGIAALILRRNVLTEAFLLWVILIAGYYIYLMFQGVPAILAHSSGFSQNAVSVHMVFVVVTYYAVALIKRRPVSIIPAVLLIVISIWAMGRGGIVTSVFLLGGILLWKIPKHPVKLLKYALLFALFVLVGLFLDYRPLTDRATELIGLEATLNDVNSRTELLSGRETTYLALATSTKPYNLMFGEEVTKSSIAANLGGNTHNSFLGLWQFTGVWAFFVFCMWLYVNFQLWLRSPLLAIVMSTVLLRTMVEHAMWFSGFDYLFFLFVFFYIGHTFKGGILGDTGNHLR